MSTAENSLASGSTPLPHAPPWRTPTNTIAAGAVCWVALSLGFLGLRMLMQERPEFVGQPLGVSKATLIQESPRVVQRKLSDDVSAIRPMQPESSEVHFNLTGRRDYRGLRTILDMSGECRARYLLKNPYDEPAFVLFQCPHPRAGNDSGANLLAGGLKLEASVEGVQDTAKGAWIWSGRLDPRQEASLEVSYHVASLNGVTYRAGDQNGNPIRQLRVIFQRQDLDSMRFESGDGSKVSTEPTVSWERRDFLAPDSFSATIVEARNLYTSLLQLLEIGPLICLLFLLTVSAVILTRQPLSALQMLTIAAGYALYFPLILYLSVRFSFAVALVIAVVVPGALLVNYGRFLVGARLGLIGGPVILALYWIFPTLAAFSGWNRGMVLLCLGIVTLWVLINLQNQALRRKMAIAGVVLLLAAPSAISAGEVQVLLPGELAAKLLETKRDVPSAVVAFEPAAYRVRHEANHLQVQVEAAFQILRPSEAIMPLFSAPVHLLERQVDPLEPSIAAIVTATNRLGLYVQRAGKGTLRLSYRIPLENREGKWRAQIPLLVSVPGSMQIESARQDLEFVSGSLWSRTTADNRTVYELGVVGEETLIAEWREQGGAAVTRGGKPAEGPSEFYGIGITRAQHLTIVNSDGSCTHFAEFEVPALQAAEFRMKLPTGARLVSVSINGNEVSAPALEGQLCRLKLPGRDPRQTAHRISFRLAYPSLSLGFLGTAELTLPEVFQTTGTTEWVVALPNGFQTQVLSSGLETQKSAPDLDRFGDYGRLLKSRVHAYLAGDLTPPRLISLSLRYRQAVPGIYELQEASR